MKKLFISIYLLVSFEVNSKSLNVLKLFCEYEPELIKKIQKNKGFIDERNLNRSKICITFGCKDIIEINKYNILSKDEYRLKNSWFNHQGILLDDFLITDNTITINTFVSQAYFLESYLINRGTGETKRTFFRFDDSEFVYNINKLKEDKKNKIPLYNEKGKISFKTLESLSLGPWETIFFEGKCTKK